MVIIYKNREQYKLQVVIHQKKKKKERNPSVSRQIGLAKFYLLSIVLKSEKYDTWAYKINIPASKRDKRSLKQNNIHYDVTKNKHKH